jgi:hypothetical protein
MIEIPRKMAALLPGNLWQKHSKHWISGRSLQALISGVVISDAPKAANSAKMVRKGRVWDEPRASLVPGAPAHLALVVVERAAGASKLQRLP